MSDYQGTVKGRVVEVRFATSGKVLKVNKFVGDRVNKNEIIASLDRKILQTELDRQLADYEKARANFEIFNQKNPDPQTALEKYLKTSEQAQLNVSVKEVELAKMKLDQCDLFSPVEGIILDDGNICEGLFITPSNTPIKIIDTSSYYFEFEIEQKDIPNFETSRNVDMEIDGLPDKLQGPTLQVLSDGRKFFVHVPLNNKHLLCGLKSLLTF